MDERVVSLDEVEAEARALWRALPPGSVVWLSGEIGAGKTAVVQALARAARAAPARSPTFALVHQYRSPEGVLAHVDCYRLRNPDEARDIDFRGLLRDARLLVVEWPERAGPHAPTPDLHLRLSHVGRSDRRRLARI